MAEIKYDVIERFGSLSESDTGWKKELTFIKWNDRDPKYDLREWSPDGSKMGKGITLSKDEALALRELLNKLEI